MNVVGPSCCIHGIRGYGNPDAGVMFVGIAPGRTEAQEGRPFVGESGRLLDAILKAAGWDRSEVYCTNLLCWWHDSPTPDEIERCMPRLQREIDAFKPRLIIPLGKIASEVFITGKKFGEAQGAVLWQNHILGTPHAAYVMPTYHPAAILHGSTLFIHSIYRDLSKIKDVVGWDELHGEGPVFTVASSAQEVQDFIDALSVGRYIALDIESAQGKDEDEQLDPFSDRLLCVGLSDGEFVGGTMVIPAEHAGGLRWREKELNWTFHNGQFDVQAMRRFLGLHLPIVDDTMLASYNLDERAGVHGLKRLAREYLAAGWYEEEAHTQAKQRKGFDKVDKAVLYDYNAKDAYYTACLAPLLYARMREDNVLWPYWHILIPAANVFADVSYRGLMVDIQRFNALELKWAIKWGKAEFDLQAHAEALGAPVPYNPNSNQQKKRLIFDILGLTPPNPKMIKTGMSLDKDALKDMSGMHPFIDEEATYRKLEHIMTGYVFPTRGHIKLDGALHVTAKLHGTVTGRKSYVRPPLDNLPNPKYESNAEFSEFREIIVPHNKDTHVIVEADYTKAELYCAVFYSGDEQMRADLESGDIHALTAATIFNKPLSEVTKWDRTRGKHVTFGKMYGRKEKALARGELRCSVLEALVFSKAWDKRYPTYVLWNKEQQRIARTNGELVSASGRKRRFRLILPQDYEMLNEAVNFPIQNLASDTTLCAMIKLHAILTEYDSYILVMSHDSLVFEVSKKYLTEVTHIIKRVMETPQFGGMPSIPVEMAVGQSWGTTKELTLETVYV